MVDPALSQRSDWAPLEPQASATFVLCAQAIARALRAQSLRTAADWTIRSLMTLTDATELLVEWQQNGRVLARVLGNRGGSGPTSFVKYHVDEHGKRLEPCIAGMPLLRCCLADRMTATVSGSRSGAAARLLHQEMFVTYAPLLEEALRHCWALIEGSAFRQVRGSPTIVDLLGAETDFADLSPREKEVVAALIEGLCAKAIARHFDISPGTVRNHLRSIYSKLHVSSQSELLSMALRSALAGTALRRKACTEPLAITGGRDDRDSVHVGL